MAKILVIKCSLIVLQLISLCVSSVIIIIHYNPWIKILIEAAQDGDQPEQVVDQFRGIEGEEIVIFLVSLATIVVSVLGIIGSLARVSRTSSHCLLNFYVHTLIIFLFVTFVAFCGTVWQTINKILNNNSTVNSELSVTWTHLTKSFLFILICAVIYAASIRLTRKILDFDDHYAIDDNGSDRHFNVNGGANHDDDSGNHFNHKSSFTRV